jgi:lysophospholipase L1-like esterase
MKTKTVLGSLFASAIASAAPRMPTHVACIGDSITQGVGASSPATDWVSDLSTTLGSGVHVGNFGVSGTTMMKVSDNPYWNQGAWTNARNFVTSAGANAVVDVIIMLGTNDSKDNPSGVDNWTSTAPDRYRADYNAMLDALLALTPKPVVFLALPPTAYGHAYDIDGTVIQNQELPIIKDIAKMRGLPIIDVFDATANLPGDFGDGIHPNDTGHALVAHTMDLGLMRQPSGVLSAVAGAGDVVLSVQSSDTVAFSHVDFLQNGSVVGSAAAAPFEFHWTGLTAGASYTVSANVTDTTTATGTAPATSFVVGADLDADIGERVDAGTTAHGDAGAGKPAAAGCAYGGDTDWLALMFVLAFVAARVSSSARRGVKA